MENVLIIEDEQELAELIQLYLDKDGFQTSWVDSAERGLLLLEEKSYDLVILDINLPGMDGFEFLRQFRYLSKKPVIIVSAREADEDIITGLGIGADEFVTKPFTPRVLTARVKALIRRSKQFSDDNKLIYSFNNFVLYYDDYILKKENNRIALSTREFEVLRFLVKKAGVIFSPDDIYDSIWEQEFGQVTAVAVYIQRIRKKIEPDYSNPIFIKTVHGKGYKFQKEVIS
jgi:two-component system response regulator RegX3